MLFSDGQDVGAGAAAFLSNFGSNPDTSPSLADTAEPISQDAATDTELSSDEGTDDGQDLAPEDLFAARLAGSLAEEGIELEGEEDASEEPSDEDGTDYENLTPEQIKAQLKEFMELKEREKQAAEETQRGTVRQAIEAAQDAAVAQVEEAFEREVLAESQRYFMDAELTKRIQSVVRNAKNADNPDAYIIQNAIAVANLIFEGRTKYEREKAQEWREHAERAKADAIKHVPELRAFYAQDLARQYGLPPEAINDINHPRRDIDNFEDRAKELVDIANSLGKKQKQSDTERRQQAHQAQMAKKVGTPSTGRKAGGKVREYTGAPEEGLPILKSLSSRWERG